VGDIVVELAMLTSFGIALMALGAVTLRRVVTR
jgi:hypothetical protein